MQAISALAPAHVINGLAVSLGVGLVLGVVGASGVLRRHRLPRLLPCMRASRTWWIGQGKRHGGRWPVAWSAA